MIGQPGPVWTGPEMEGDSPAMVLSALLGTLARHRLLLVSITLACVLGAGVWLERRAPNYAADARILVSPVPAGDSAFVGLPLIRASELDPQRAPNTAAKLLESPTALRRAAARLDTAPAQLAAVLEVTSSPESSLVEIRAEAESAAAAAEIATTYAEVALGERDRMLGDAVAAAIDEAEEQLALLGPSSPIEAGALDTRLAALRAIADRGDPTLSLARPAPPGEAQNTPVPQVLILALLSGVLLAGLTIVMIELLVGRPLEAEAELAEVYPLPILARTPDTLHLGSSIEKAGELPPGVREGFRALRGQLELRAGEGKGASVLLVSPEADPDRGWCALHLARAFASVRRDAVAVELDPGSRQVVTELGVDPAASVAELLRGVSVDEVAQHVGLGARFVAAPVIAERVPRDEVSARTVAFVDDARSVAEWVVVGAPPVAEAPADTLAVLGAIEQIVVVVRIGSTHPDALAALKGLMEQAGREPDGYLVIDGRLSSRRTPVERPW